jgi:uncharacterized protein
MTWLQTASGRAFDLMNPDWRQVDFAVDVPEALARIARFTGHVRAGPYSVAQHCVIGADAVFRETKDRQAAAAFLLHDAHEAYVGDIATPIVAALVERANFFNTPGIGQMVIGKALTSLKATVDREIYRAAGLGAGEGCPLAYRDLVKCMDLRMLATEARHLLGPAPQPWAILVGVEPIRMVGKLTVWPWTQAADEYRERLRRYLPEPFAPVAPRPEPKAGPASRGTRLARQPLPETMEA